jgi:hypothetical protein
MTRLVEIPHDYLAVIAKDTRRIKSTCVPLRVPIAPLFSDIHLAP